MRRRQFLCLIAAGVTSACLLPAADAAPPRPTDPQPWVDTTHWTLATRGTYAGWAKPGCPNDLGAAA